MRLGEFRRYGLDEIKDDLEKIGYGVEILRDPNIEVTEGGRLRTAVMENDGYLYETFHDDAMGSHCLYFNGVKIDFEVVAIFMRHFYEQAPEPKERA